MKQIKDPIYGYVEIDDFCFPLIDSPEFQRLRNIVQTGYQSLYPSALHNRFVHSIGVFHLGKKAFDCFKANVESCNYKEYKSTDWDKYRNTFIIACLLHDVGHSPFSHTGEEFYKNSTNFLKELSDLFPETTEFAKDISTNTGKPHEAMSALVGTELLHKSGIDVDKELFVRSIIGVEYKLENKLIENTIIGMLNGSLIDVDKLDYLIRDSYVTGFNTMVLDVDRLFSGYVISEFIDESYSKKRVAAYKRSSLSVIENVTFANDLERHWIQNNPTILYDVKLIQLAIERYDAYMMKKYSSSMEGCKSIFSKKSISTNGYTDSDVPLSLLCDDDIICFLKNELYRSDISKQYFDRKQRLKPLWKSEIEFRNLQIQTLGNETARQFKSELKAIKDNTFFINDEQFTQSKKVAETLQHECESSGDEEKRNRARISLNSQKSVVKVFETFYNFSKQYGLNNDYALVFVDKHYESNYAKLENEEIYIEFNPNRVIQLKDALSVKAIDSSDEEKTGYYYIFSSKSNIDTMKNRNLDFAKELFQFIRKNW